RLGATRQGPLAPEAFQLGKYDVFTSTGVPGRSTSKEMRSSLVWIPLTFAGVTGRRAGRSMRTSLPAVAAAPAVSVRARRTRTRGHSFGPSTAKGTSHDRRFW